MKKNSSSWFCFMRLTHTISILKIPELELVAIVDTHPENTRKNLNEQVGNFSTGTLSEDLFSKIKNYTDLKDCTAAETTLIPAGDATIDYSSELEYFLECLEKGTKTEKCMPGSALKTIEICYHHL